MLFLVTCLWLQKKLMTVIATAREDRSQVCTSRIYDRLPVPPMIRSTDGGCAALLATKPGLISQRCIGCQPPFLPTGLHLLIANSTWSKGKGESLISSLSWELSIFFLTSFKMGCETAQALVSLICTLCVCTRNQLFPRDWRFKLAEVENKSLISQILLSNSQ